MPEERFCRRERRRFPEQSFTTTAGGRFIHEVVGNRHYSDGEQVYAANDRRGRVRAAAKSRRKCR
jgi:hypothetical protein